MKKLDFGTADLFFKDLVGSAMIRELHVYGKVVQTGNDQKETQHIGLGTKLLIEAERIAKENEFKKIVVISGVGVRNYYRKRGYTTMIDGEFLMKINFF